MEVTKWLKPSISVSLIGDSASVAASFNSNQACDVCLWQILLQKSAAPSKCTTFESNGRAA